MKQNILLLFLVTTAIISKAQIISTKTISLDAAKKVVAEAVKFAKANKETRGQKNKI